jgi:hypothetical protein
MEHVDVLLALRDADAPITAKDVESATRHEASVVARCLADLVGANLARHDLSASTYTYSASADDRLTIDALAVLQSQWPGTLAMVFYNEPPKPLKSFSKAFRLRNDKKDT